MAHDVTAPALQRLRRLLTQRVRPAMLRTVGSFEVSATPESFDPVPFAAIGTRTLEPFTIGDAWGRPWHSRWFRLSTRLDGVSANEHLVAHVDLGFTGRGDGFQVEGLAWQDGCPVQAVQPDRRLIPLRTSGGATDDGRRVELWIEAAATPVIAGHASGYGPTPLGDPRTAGSTPLYALRRAELCVRDESVATLSTMLHALVDLIIDLDDRQPYRARLFAILENLERVLDPADVAGTATAATTFLDESLRAVPADHGMHRIVAAGHAHLDTAWLWPIRETRRKALRTFVNAVDLLDRNPDVVFSHSQAQHYAWVFEDAPDVFERVRRHVERGRWEPVGGMWVETDLNLPSGESLLRQFSEGQRAFAHWFGRRSRVAFLPDDFGYPGSIPQIVRHAGARWFFTQKMSWNESNSFPHHSFWWEGIDGTRVFTHFSPVDTYNALLTPSQLRFAARNFRDHAGATCSLALFGHGDGGGGPTQDMIDRARLAADLPDVPAVAFGTVEGFFTEAESEYAARAPVWVGEMYLEKHRGTYSSQVATKQGNRRCERLLHELELWSALAGVEQPDASGLWRRVLVQQFHDIIPGSSIAWVHRDAETEHQAVAADIEARLMALPRQKANGQDACVENPAPVARREVFIDADHGGRWGLIDIPAFGHQVLDVDAWGSLPADVTEVTHETDSTGSITVSNGGISCTIDPRGHLVRLVEITTGRSIVGLPVRGGHAAPISSGRLLIRRDTPAEYDAWDIDRYDADAPAVVLESVAPPRIEVATPGFVRVSAEFVHGDSSFVLRWTMRAGSSRLDVQLDADWRQHEERLQWAMPVDIMARDAVCGIQFGHVTRARHSNTSWDQARFEVCAHRYVRVAEPDCGVALMADGPRGYDIRGRQLSLTLLRSPQFPDPECDLGHRVVDWSIFADRGDAGVREVEEEAARLAHPVRKSPGLLVTGGVGLSLQATGILVSAVKLADDGSGDLVVRVWECRGARSCGRLDLTGRSSGVVECNALEDVVPDDERRTAPGGVVLDGDRITVELDLAPFEIRTYRFR